MKKILSSVFTCLILLSPFVANAMTMRNAVADPEDSDLGYTAKVFADYVNEHSAGKLTVTNFYAGALGDESEALRNVQTGNLALAGGSISNMVPFDKNLGILTLPYVYDNMDDAIFATTGEPAEMVNSWLVPKGLRILAYAFCGFRNPSNSVKPIKKFGDMKGLKIRVAASPVLVSTITALGGQPTPISWAETFTALQQKVVDGQDAGYVLFATNKFNEANQKYITEAHYSYLFQAITISERIFRKLPESEQKLLIEAGQYAQAEGLKYSLELLDQTKQQLIDLGIQIDSLEDEAVWKEAALKNVWPSMVDEVGGIDAINAYLAILGKPAWENK